MDLKEIVISMRNWVDSAQDRDYWRTLVNATLEFLIVTQFIISLRKLCYYLTN